MCMCMYVTVKDYSNHTYTHTYMYTYINTHIQVTLITAKRIIDSCGQTLILYIHIYIYIYIYTYIHNAYIHTYRSLP